MEIKSLFRDPGRRRQIIDGSLFEAKPAKHPNRSIQDLFSSLAAGFQGGPSGLYKSKQSSPGIRDFVERAFRRLPDEPDFVGPAEPARFSRGTYAAKRL